MTDDQTGADAGADHATKAAELSCPACGEIVYAEEVFCEKCGHRLTDAPPPGGTAAREPSSARPCTNCGGTAIDADGYCENCGLRQPAERDHVELELPAPGGNGGRAGGVLGALRGPDAVGHDGRDPGGVRGERDHV
ncbi:zinc ribbon domain-containing protein, partial [Actinomadura sp. BRA 177]|uniref:double zinc ribbon domain-containing protein n=1 Tax=Actinomadura sp. BRA 177 TaxID=2745202 RepID=UPI0028152FB7